MKKNEIVLFETKDSDVKLTVQIQNETVWLTSNQMALLFGRDEKTIRKHVNNVFRENEVEYDNNTQKMRVDGVKQPVEFYTLDVIISVGYRVKSKRGVEFRRWANSVLKKYIMDGYAINEKRLLVLSLEEKAANLLYFMIKDHPFADGCKRIAASLFLEFLERNNSLYVDGRKRIGDGELVAITLMIAESNSVEKDIMVKLVMNLLNMN